MPRGLNAVNMTTSWRTFGGEDYKFHYGTPRKTEAQSVARRLRSKRWAARVIRCGQEWCVYRRVAGPN